MECAQKKNGKRIFKGEVNGLKTSCFGFFVLSLFPRRDYTKHILCQSKEKIAEFCFWHGKLKKEKGADGQSFLVEVAYCVCGTGV